MLAPGKGTVLWPLSVIVYSMYFHDSVGLRKTGFAEWGQESDEARTLCVP